MCGVGIRLRNGIHELQGAPVKRLKVADQYWKKQGKKFKHQETIVSETQN